jgi:lipopolysaccharide export system protein LptA
MFSRWPVEAALLYSPPNFCLTESMKRSEAAKYARWSATAALLLAMLTVGVYVKRKWVAHEEKAKAPPPAPQGVTRQESGLTFSKELGPQKLFTVQASKATNFKNNPASLLEDVKITIFGKTGERHDVIHTHSCQYDKDGSNIVCSGEVQLDFQSAADAEKAAQGKTAAAQKVHIETSAVTFNRSSGIAQTDQQVRFVFPGGQGEAVGLEYHSEQGTVHLVRNISFSLTPPASPPGTKSPKAAHEPVHITGKSADFERDTRVMRLYGPVEARTTTARLLAGELKLDLNQAFRAEKLEATRGTTGRNPEVESRGTDSQTRMSGETLTAYFAPEGWLTRIEGGGDVQGAQQTQKDKEDCKADKAALELRPKINQPKELKLTGNVQLKASSEESGETRTLQTSALLVDFAEHEKGKSSTPERAETLARGTLEWTNPAEQPGTPAPAAETGLGRTILAADKLELSFGPEGKAQKLTALGNVATERTLPGKPLQTATAQNGSAQLLSSGGWSQMELQGDVKLKEGDRNARADHALFVRSAQAATLTGNAFVRDATTETQAPRITFVQNSGEIRADGGVRSTDFSARASGLQLAPVPANISADTLRANSKTGRALYTGHARLWQGDSVMEANSIELLRDKKILNASGNVRAVFPQTPAQVSSQPVAVQQAAAKKLKLWHVTAGQLTYNDVESRAHLEKNVVAKSADQEMRAPVADLYFTRAEKASAVSPGAAQQISRAVGTGGVIVEQGGRRATAERGEYTAAEEKFVMSGGNPTIFDASEGTTTGRQLTFFLADDTIIVDSEKGSRTLTKHRVEK